MILHLPASSVRCLEEASDGKVYAPRPDPQGEAERQGCEDCLKIGARWVHLRLCLSCVTLDVCDSSPNRHATKHFQQTTHPIVQSFEPGEDWRWCYADQIEV